MIGRFSLISHFSGSNFVFSWCFTIFPYRTTLAYFMFPGKPPEILLDLDIVTRIRRKGKRGDKNRITVSKFYFYFNRSQNQPCSHCLL